MRIPVTRHRRDNPQRCEHERDDDPSHVDATASERSYHAEALQGLKRRSAARIAKSMSQPVTPMATTVTKTTSSWKSVRLQAMT